jgi:phage anti-repressor protein
MNKSLKIGMKDFLKTYTGISVKFINEYYKFYEMCELTKYGIDVEDLIKYLDIKKKEKFYSNIRKKYVEGVNYIKKELIHKKTINQKATIYYLDLNTFEKICMESHAKKANEVRDYFIKLREFINYYKSNISNMIINKSLEYPDGSIYIILANKNKNIFKLGITKDIRKRLQNHATGKDTHPDVKFIMLVNNRKDVENCVKKLSHKYQFKKNQELYKVDIDIIKKHIFDCASVYTNDIELYNNKNVDSYIIFDNTNNTTMYKKASKKASKKVSNKVNKKTSKKTGKKTSKTVNKKASKKASKKVNKKASKTASKKVSKTSKKA